MAADTETNGSLEATAVALAALVVENERASGKTFTRQEVFLTYAQCLRRVRAFSARLDNWSEDEDENV